MKKIKVKLQQCGNEALGFTYRIEQVVNALKVNIGNEPFLVGEYLKADQAEDICYDRKYVVTVNAIES
jgi:hypothetical protein